MSKCECMCKCGYMSKCRLSVSRPIIMCKCGYMYVRVLSKC